MKQNIQIILVAAIAVLANCFSDTLVFSTSGTRCTGITHKQGVQQPTKHHNNARIPRRQSDSKLPASRTIATCKQRHDMIAITRLYGHEPNNSSNNSNNPDKNIHSMIDSQGDRSRGILVLMTVPLAWGTFEPVVRFVYQIEPPIPGLVFSPCYYFVAAVALSTLSFVSSLSQSPPTNTLVEMESTKSDSVVPLSVWGGMELGFYLFLGNALQVLALKTINSDRVAFLIQLTTIFVPLVQGIAARNLFAIPTRTWIACFIALCGVGVMGLEAQETVLFESINNLPEAQGFGLANLFSQQQFLSQGDYLVVGSALAYTFHCIRLEKYAKETRAVTLAACKATTETFLSLMLVAGLLLFYGTAATEMVGITGNNNNFLINFALESGDEISSFFTTIPQRLMDGSIPPSVLWLALGAVLWTGLVTCGYTIYAQSFGQSRVTPSDANLIYTFQPVWTSLIAFVLLGETLGPSGFVGGALIGVAVWMVITSEPSSPSPQQRVMDDTDIPFNRDNDDDSSRSGGEQISDLLLVERARTNTTTL